MNTTVDIHGVDAAGVRKRVRNLPKGVTGEAPKDTVMTGAKDFLIRRIIAVGPNLS